jgi:hypothetical protein
MITVEALLGSFIPDVTGDFLECGQGQIDDFKQNK